MFGGRLLSVDQGVGQRLIVQEIYGIVAVRAVSVPWDAGL